MQNATSEIEITNFRLPITHLVSSLKTNEKQYILQKENEKIGLLSYYLFYNL